MQFNFDPNSVAPRENKYEVIPAGWYVAQVTESSVESLKSGNGQCIKLRFDVMAEGYRGRVIFARLNVRHTNPEAERIGQQQLRELCEAIGLVRMTDTAQLHNKPVCIKIKVRPAEGQYEAQNEVNAFKPATGTGGTGVPAAFGAQAGARPGFPPAPPRSSAPAAAPMGQAQFPAPPGIPTGFAPQPPAPSMAPPSEPAPAATAASMPPPFMTPAAAPAPAAAPPWAVRPGA